MRVPAQRACRKSHSQKQPFPLKVVWIFIAILFYFSRQALMVMGVGHSFAMLPNSSHSGVFSLDYASPTTQTEAFFPDDSTISRLLTLKNLVEAFASLIRVAKTG